MFFYSTTFDHVVIGVLVFFPPAFLACHLCLPFFPRQPSLWLNHTHTDTPSIHRLTVLQWVAVIALSFLKNPPIQIQPINIVGMQLCGHTIFTVMARNLNHKRCYFPIDTNWVKKKELQSPLYTCCDRFFLLASKVSCNRMWAACRQGGQPDSQPVNRNYLRRVMIHWVRNGQRRVEKRSQQSISAKLQVWRKRTAKVLVCSEEKHFCTLHVISMCQQMTRKHVWLCLLGIVVTCSPPTLHWNMTVV